MLYCLLGQCYIAYSVNANAFDHQFVVIGELAQRTFTPSVLCKWRACLGGYQAVGKTESAGVVV